MSPATPLGKCITIGVLYGPGIFLCAAVIGIVGAAYHEAIKEDEKESF